jgi:hypothetical protein
MHANLPALSRALLLSTSAVALALAASPARADNLTFVPGDLVVSVYGDGDGSGSYGDNQAAPIVLQQLTTTGLSAGQMTLPQTNFASNGVQNYAISGEYGSSSEGTLQLSGDGQSLVIAGYGVNAATFNAGGAAVYGTAALAQSTPSGSLTQGSTITPVSRVVADISYTGSVDTSTSLNNVFNGNNPRSVATVNGSTFYVSGQGQSGDTTEGLFVAQDGASTATAINTTYDTRTVEISNNTLYVSQDSKVGKGQLAFIASVGTPGTLPTGPTTPSILSGVVTGSPKSADPGELKLSAGQGNSINLSSGSIYLSPENYFFANATTLYVADSGDPKAGGVGDGGLQKWVLQNGTWTLEYTISAGLNLVNATTATSGTTGLIGLTGEVVGDSVELFATNATLGDLDQTYLYGVDDQLNATTNPGDTFSVLETAAPDTIIRGVAFAPSADQVPEPASMAALGFGLAGLMAVRRRRRA